VHTYERKLVRGAFCSELGEIVIRGLGDEGSMLTLNTDPVSHINNISTGSARYLLASARMHETDRLKLLDQNAFTALALLPAS
jgi:hypothetical protein